MCGMRSHALAADDVSADLPPRHRRAARDIVVIGIHGWFPGEITGRADRDEPKVCEYDEEGCWGVLEGEGDATGGRW